MDANYPINQTQLNKVQQEFENPAKPNINQPQEQQQQNKQQTMTDENSKITYRNQRQSSSQSSQNNKKVQKQLHLFTLDQDTLPSKEEFSDVYESFRNSTKKFFNICLKTLNFLLTHLIRLIKKIILLIIQLLGLLLKYPAKALIISFGLIERNCCKKINKKDPFKRNLLNINYGRLKELNETYESYTNKAFNLVLDLDNTLIHSSPSKINNSIPCQISFKSGCKMTYHIKKRQHLQEFLQELSKYYNIIIYTAQEQEYADPIINIIDPKKIIKKRYYRDNCTKHPNGFIKDLQLVCPDMSKVVMIDTSKFATQLNEDNTLIIPPYYGNDDDEEFVILETFKEILQSFVVKKTDFRDQVQEIKDSYF